MSFRREKFVPKGGPDGGDGGRGASIYLKADSQLRTLLDYRYKTHWKGEHGAPGHGTNKTGKSGEDEWLRVPPGTEVRDFDTGELAMHHGDPPQPPHPAPAPNRRKTRWRGIRLPEQEQTHVFSLI